MLQDPEKPFEEWQSTVRAPNQDAALGLCEKVVALAPLVEVVNVTQATSRPDKQGNFKYICWFRGEVTE